MIVNTTEKEIIMTFEELGIDENIIKSISEIGFEKPMPIQEKVIPFLLKEEVEDIIALAQTGTGKTAVFGIPIIQKTDVNSKKVQSLILCPTRELCVQIEKDIVSYSKYVPGIKIVAVYGGASIEKQISAIKKGVQIISATPGRLKDLINRNIIDLSYVNTLVLDEADEMLNMGFQDDVEEILESIPPGKNTLLFSATMPAEVAKIAQRYMQNPIEISVGKKNAGSDDVEHLCYFVHSKDRYLALKRIVDNNPDIYGIVFCRTRKETQEIADKLIQDGYNADSLHGDLSQVQRDIVMDKFRIKHLQLLVATDVAARGLDVDNLSHIINYNLPEELELYTHRSGRTGRAGKKGISILIAGLKEKSKIHQIEKGLNKKFTFCSVPLGKDICEKQLLFLIDKVEKVEVDYSQINPYLPEAIKKLEWLGRDELIARFLSVEFNRFLDYYKNTPDLNIPVDERRKGKTSKDFSGFTRFFINLGKTDDLKPVNLIGLVNDYTGMKDIEIGDIDILNNFSFFEADSSYTDLILTSFENKTFKKRRIGIEIASEKKRSSEKRGGSSDKKRSGSRDQDNKRRGGRDSRGGSGRDSRGSSGRDSRGSSGRDSRGSSSRDSRGNSDRDSRGSSDRGSQNRKKNKPDFNEGGKQDKKSFSPKRRK